VATGGTALTFSPGPLPVTTLYRLQQTDTYCAPDQVVYTNIITITVYDPLIAGTASPDQSICYGGAPIQLLATPAVGGSGNYSYQWQWQTGTGPWTTITSANLLTYTPTALFATTQFRLMQTDNSCNPDQIVHTNIVTINVEIPTADAGPNDTLCGLLPYTLEFANSQFGVNYVWSTSGTGSFSSQYQLNPTYFPSPADMNTGIVVLTLTITDQCNNIVTDNMSLTLSQPPVSYFTFTTPACSGSSVFFDDLSVAVSGYIKQWIWNYGDGSPADTIDFPENPNTFKVFENPGTYPVTLKVLNSHGCSDEFTTSVTLLPAPIANFQYYHPCENTIVEFTDASYPNGAGNVISWSWNFDDPGTGINNTSTLKNPTHIFSQGNKTYNVRLIIVNFNNCSDTMVKEVFIRQAPPVDFTHSITCLDELVYFDPDTTVTNVNSIGFWNWDFGDGITSNNQNAAHLYEAPGTYNVTLYITDTSGCENYISHAITINPLPIAHFDAGTINCAGSATYFDELSSTSTGYIVRWEWDFGDGNTQVILHPDNPDAMHTYLVPGIYNVSLTVRSSDSCSKTETQALTIDSKPVANFDFIPPACENNLVTFTDLSQNNGGGNITQWNWNFDDQTTGINNISILQNPAHLFSSTGEFNVQLIAVTANGCSDTVVREIVIIAKPAVDFITQSNCQNAEVLFQPNPVVMNPDAIATWYWIFGDGFTSTLESPSHIYSTTGTYSVTLTVIDTAGCMNTIIKPVIIVPQPISNFDFSQPACRLSAIQFISLASATAGYIVNWTWAFGDGDTLVVTNTGNPNVSHTYGNYGTFIASLTVTTNNNCTATITKNVIVAPNPLAEFAYAANCINIPVQFDDLSQSGTGILTDWSWNFGDPSTGTANQSAQQNPEHIFSSSASTFTVRLIVTNSSGCIDTVYHQVNLNPLPVVDFSVTESCSGDTTQFISSTFVNTGTTSEWLWDFGDGNTSVEADPVHIYNSSGTFMVTLVITGTDGCTNSSTHTITIVAPPMALFQPSEQQCAGFPVNFDDLSNPAGGEITFWYWDFGDGTDTTIFAPSNPDISHIYTNQGNYVVSLQIYTVGGCEDNTTQTVIITGSPLALFGYSGTCEDESVNFINQSTNNGGTAIAGYNWNFGDPASGTANTSVQANPVHIYMNTGTYTVTLVVTNSNGCTNAYEDEVFINPKPLVDFSWANTCFEETTQFTVNAVTTNIPAVQTFDWDFGDGSPHSTVQDPQHNYNSPGIYTVILDIIDTAGCSNQKIYQVTINPKPDALFSYSTFGCLNSPVQFTDESYVSNGEPIISWHWDFGVTSISNDTSNLQNPAWTFSANGLYYVTLKVVSASGCMDSIQLPIQVFGQPVANFSYTLPFCSTAVDFQDSSYSHQSVIVQWHWEFEPNQYSNLPNPHHVFYASDSCYNVKLIVTDYKGCTDTIIKQVCIPAGLSVTVNYDNTCFSDTTHFFPEVLAPAGSTLTAFNWNFGDPVSGTYNTSTSANPAHLFSQPGTYTVLLQTSDNNNCTAFKYLFVTIDPLPEPKFSYLSGICDSIVVFHDLSSGNGSPLLSWIWDYGDGFSDTVTTTGMTDLSHHYPNPGYYNARLTVTNEKSCVAEYNESIFVNPCIDASINTESQQVCQNYPVAFTDSSYSGIPISDWIWDFGDNTIIQYQPPHSSIVVHSFENSGYHTVKLIIKTAFSGTEISDSTSMIIFVKPSPVSDYEVKNVCLGDSVMFMNKSSGNNTTISSYTWVFRDPLNAPNDISHSQDVSYLYAIAGEYLPLLIAENSIGCIDTSSYPVTVYSPPDAHMAVNNPCIGHPTDFVDMSDSGSGSIVDWAWTITDVSGVLIVDTIQNPKITFTKTGDFNANLIVTDANGCADTTSRAFTELTGPTGDFSFVEQIDGQEWQIKIDNHSKEAISYEWDFGNNTYSNAEDPVATFDEEGEYLITLISTNENSCTDTTYKNYQLIFKGLYIPTAFAPEDPKGNAAIFQPKGQGLKTFSIQVFNQWGDVVWESATENLIDGEPGEGWDGKYRGEYVRMGVYVWVASAVFLDGTIWNGTSLGNNTNLSQNVYGTVMVIR
jgi:PKD repeat protein